MLYIIMYWFFEKYIAISPNAKVFLCSVELQACLMELRVDQLRHIQVSATPALVSAAFRGARARR